MNVFSWQFRFIVGPAIGICVGCVVGDFVRNNVWIIVEDYDGGTVVFAAKNDGWYFVGTAVGLCVGSTAGLRWDCGNDDWSLADINHWNEAMKIRSVSVPLTIVIESRKW